MSSGKLGNDNESRLNLIHNTLKNANVIPSIADYDVEFVVLKIYSKFDTQPGKVESLKEFCEFASA